MFKEHLKFPQQESMEPMAGGVGGIHDNVSPTNRPLNMLSVCRNMRRSGVTGATTRPGRTMLGDVVGLDQILGISHYYKSNGSKKLISASGKALKYYDANTETWNNIKNDLSSGKQYHAVTFNDLHLITNGTDNVMKYDGSTVGNLGGSPPKGKYITSGYQRVVISGVSGSPHLIYFSDIANPEDWGSGELSDSAAIPVNDKDGDEIKWVQLYKSNFVIWKRYSFYELHGPELGQTSDDWSVVSIAAIGTPNGRTVADVNGMLYWLSDSGNSRGIVRWAGGQPVLISEPIESLVSTINYAAIDTACAASSGDGEYLLAVPTGNSGYPDTIIVYNANDNSWWVWDGWNPTMFLQYRLGDTATLLIGDNDGCVYTFGGDVD